MKGPKGKGALTAVVHDLEILPLMNLFVVLIPMLLLSAVFLEMSVVRMSPPAESTAAADSPGDKLMLAVTVAPDCYVVEGIGIPAERVDRSDGAGEERLRRALESIGRAYPENENVMILSEDRTRYETIVRVMDIAREAGTPHVSLLGTDGIVKEGRR